LALMRGNLGLDGCPKSHKALFFRNKAVSSESPSEFPSPSSVLVLIYG
jgi:hypothetical protein